MKPITNKLEQNLRERIDAMLAKVRKTDTYKNESLLCNIVISFTDRMKFKKITQKELAQKTDLKESYISRILTRDCNPTLNTIRKIAEVLDLEIKIEPKRSFESSSHKDVKVDIVPVITKAENFWKSEGDYNEAVNLAA
ncbi:MAG: helix-turn-helix transcriptional regulator [Candidatus Riflebacteria bacterium]|nr:helix-turn-helix transcriptional regulator [Candidatus Riflebacteria bacterium]